MTSRGASKSSGNLAHAPEDPFTWRRIFAARDTYARVRAKALPLEVHWTDSLGIDEKVAAYQEASQGAADVQPRPLSKLDNKILASIQRRGGFATSIEIACDVRASRERVVARLDKFVGERRVRSIEGQGYELRERA